jgi:hypothetical protein
MKNTKGLSAVVTTLIIILLVLVAVGIIWVVVKNVVEGGAETIEFNTKCVAVDLSANSASCTQGAANWTCDVTYQRRAGGDDIDGLKIVLSNGLTSFTHDVPGNLQAPATRTTTGINTTIPNASPEPNSVALAAYFLDASEEEHLCNPTGERTF